MNSDGAEEDSERMRPYEFGHGQKLSPGQKRGLQMMGTALARKLTGRLSACLGFLVTAEYRSHGEESYEELSQKVRPGSTVSSFTVSPSQGQMLLLADADLTGAMTDICLGAQAPAKDGDWTREEQGELEQAVLRVVLDAVSGAVMDACQEGPSIEVKASAIEANPLLLPVFYMDETLALMHFHVTLGESSGMLTLGATMQILNVLLQSAVPSILRDQARNPERGETVSTELVLGATVGLRCLLGRAVLSLGQARAMEPYDIIVLDTMVDDPLEVTVQGKCKFLGRPCVSEGRLSVYIERVLSAEEQEGRAYHRVGRTRA